MRGPSMPLQQLWHQIETRFGGFSPQLQRAARFVRENPQDVALLSLRNIAARAGVSPATMTRLMQALEIETWCAFQSLHRHWLTTGRQGVFSGPADRVVTDARHPGAENLLLESMARLEGLNLESALGPPMQEPLRKAARLIALAPTVAIAGLRSSFPVAYGLHYALSLFLAGTVLMPGAGSALLDGLHHLRPGAVLITISISPYSRETVSLARLAHEAGCPVVAITDGPLSPLAQIADITLIARTDSPSHLASLVGLMAVAQALAMLVLARAGDGALETMRHRETIFETTSAYLPTQD